MNSYRLLYLVALILTGLFGVSQDTELEIETVRKINDFHQSNPFNKLFVHLDKSAYAIGDDIWYKVYATDAKTNQLTLLNQVVYVELVDTNGETMISQRHLLKNGMAHGQFQLNGELVPAAYKLVAYTNWMRNWDSSYWFQRHIEVIDPLLTSSVSAQDNRKFKVEFFPEGGDLIAGLSTKVAVKAMDNLGLGFATSGDIFGENGELITSFETNELGFGAFTLNPRGAFYYSMVHIADKTLKFELPLVKNTGFSLSVHHNFNSGNIMIAVAAKDESLANSFVIAHRNGIVFFSARKESETGAFITRLSKKLFPPGIVHLTFFDSSGTPRAERLLYVNQFSFQNDLAISADKKSYGNRQLVTLDVRLQNEGVDSLNSGTFSVSVVNDDRNPLSPEAMNIKNYLTISSDLQGPIERPGYYESWTKQSYSDLDLLLLTQGWRRFKWEEILLEDYKPTFQVEDGLTVSGTVVDNDRRNLPRKAEITLSILGDWNSVTKGQTDEDGRFAFTGMDKADSIEVFLQAKLIMGNRKERLVENAFIKIDTMNDDSVEFDAWVPKLKRMPKVIIEEMASFEKRSEEIRRAFQLADSVIVLDEVAIVTQKEDRTAIYEPGNIYGTPTTRLVMDSIPSLKSFTNMFDVLKQMPRVRVLGSFPNQGIRLGGSGSVIGGQDPLFIIDGVYVDIKTFQDLNPRDIHKIDVVNGPDAAVYGSQGANGAVIAYTRGVFGSYAYQKKIGTRLLKLAGFSGAKEFYSPDYSFKIEEHSKPDLRSTLYWQPQLSIKDGQAQVLFYTSDENGKYHANIQGITNLGVPISKTIRFYVE